MELKVTSCEGVKKTTPDFWFDTDSFVTPSRGPDRFSTLPRFWEFLELKASEQVIASSELVLNELLRSKDELAAWAKKQQGTLFLIPDQDVQGVFSQIAENVKNNKRFAACQVDKFLKDADPWVIAHAKALGGRVVTFEKPEPTSTKPKIPDVADDFDVKCINLWDLLTELHASF